MKLSEIFPETVTKFRINGAKLTLAREAVGLSMKSFAESAGWSRSYQRKLETETETVAEDTRDVILQVLEEARKP